MIGWNLLAAETATKAYWRLNRLYAIPEGWQWLALAALVLAVLGYVFVMYLRDGIDLARGVKYSLVLFRFFAVAALVFFFLDMEKGSERQLIKNSRVLLLADTSLSMASADVGVGVDSVAKRRRVDELVEAIEDESFIRELQERHDVLVYQFDSDPQPQLLASFPKRIDEAQVKNIAAERLQRRQDEFDEARKLLMISAGVAAGGFLLLAICGFLALTSMSKEARGWLTFAATLLLIGGCSTAFAAHLRHSDFSLSSLLGMATLADSAANEESSPGSESDDGENSSESEETEEGEEAPVELDWAKSLAPKGVETRLGDAVLAMVNQERGGPIAGIAIFTDGGHNAGVDVPTAMLSAKDAGIPVFAIGLGSDKRPVNARVVDIDVPKRAYPRDEFPLTGYVQAYGMKGKQLTVELYAIKQTGEKSADQDAINNPPIDALVADAQITLEGDGAVTPVRFKSDQAEEGRFAYVMRAAAPKEDAESKDNQKSAVVEVVDQKTKVLLLAGGPSREFRFLRNQLHRDSEITSHVWLQSGKPGMSQEADSLLFEFPSTPVELYEYDAIIAFDPDWMLLTAEQIDLMEKWIAEKAGGLIVVAGPVNTPTWANLTRSGDARIAKVKGIYPVVFYSWRSATLSLGRFGGIAAWPLRFSQDGLDADFLWLAEDAIASEAAWASFEGVYGYYAVKDPKLGARVYARFSDPDTALDGDLPIYMAGHFYGAGRVFFQASGEMWRVRAIDDTYFQQYYTKLLRWAAAGRLLRDSKHGVLLVDKERCLIGDHLSVSALLYDSQHEPLSVDSVMASLAHPDGSRSELELRRVKESARDGMYSAQFTATSEGDYRIEMIPPQSADQELLTRLVRARVPALETERPERNDPLLRELTQKTGATYFIGAKAAVDPNSAAGGLVAALSPADQETLLPGVPDRRFSLLLRTWLLALICGALCLEWITRRLNKLA